MELLGDIWKRKLLMLLLYYCTVKNVPYAVNFSPWNEITEKHIVTLFSLFPCTMLSLAMFWFSHKSRN